MWLTDVMSSHRRIAEAHHSARQRGLGCHYDGPVLSHPGSARAARPVGSH